MAVNPTLKMQELWPPLEIMSSTAQPRSWHTGNLNSCWVNGWMGGQTIEFQFADLWLMSFKS